MSPYPRQTSRDPTLRKQYTHCQHSSVAPQAPQFPARRMCRRGHPTRRPAARLDRSVEQLVRQNKAATRRVARSSGNAQTARSSLLRKNRASERAGKLDWPWKLNYTGIRSHALAVRGSTLGSGVGVFGFRAWIIGKLPQALFQSIAERFEYVRAGLANVRFRFRANVCHNVARVFVQRRYGSDHPRVRNVLEPVAVLFRGVITQLHMLFQHLRFVRFGHLLPGFQQRRESLLHFLSCFADPAFERAGQRAAEALQELLLLRRSLLRNFRAAGLDLRKGSARRFAHCIAKSRELFAALSLNFVRKGRRRCIGSFCEKRPRPVKRLTHHFFHLRLRVLHKAEARMIQFRREDARDL